LPTGRCSASDEKFVASLTDFFNNSNVGLAVFDEELRYQAINPFLANIHRYPVDFHLGRTVRTILGAVADGAEPAIRRVFATGCTISNLEVGGKLPTKTVTERWVDNFFPIKDQTGEVRQVGGIIVPVPAATKGNEISFCEEPTPPVSVLRSWKEIAGYVGTCAKTVQRWEQSYRFPIRRVKASKGSVIFAVRREVDTWLSNVSRTALGDKRSWATFLNSPLPIFILDDARVILDTNPSMANLIKTTAVNLVGQKLDDFISGATLARTEREWLFFKKAGASVGLGNFCRLDGTVIAAEYTLSTMQPGIRSLMFTSLRNHPVSKKHLFHRTGPGVLQL
jgi:PAS domain-containing protein